MNHPIFSSRRHFLRQAASAAPWLIPASALGRAGNLPPSDRILVGSVGVGPQGAGVMSNFLAQSDCRVVAVCDVKKKVLEAVRNKVDAFYGEKGCTPYHDFRELLARPDIDVVTVAPPDHWHVLVALAAVRAGKDIYLEKPMGLSLQEDQVLRAECQRRGTIFQFGTQQRSTAIFRQACELVRNGRIGRLQTINVWSPGSSAGGPRQPVPIPPDYIDYDLWLGPAPYAPYTEDRCENKWWWFISDYALGFIAGWGIHPVDIALWGGADLLQGPMEVQGTGDYPTPEGVADTALDWDLQYRFASGVVMNFTGYPVPEEWRRRYINISNHGTAFEGTEGWVQVRRSGIEAYPKKILGEHPGAGEVHLPVSTNHARNLLDCVRSRSRTVSPIEESVWGDTICHVGDIAARTRQKLIWDPEKERFTNSETANRYLVREMRSPWHL